MDNLKTMTAHADALKAAGRVDLALQAYDAAARAHPNNPIALHNLAACLGDAGLHDQSAKMARRAMALGLRAPETQLVLARALMNTGDNNGALAAFDNVLSIQPSMIPAQLERAQLVWMLTADAERSLEVLQKALEAQPETPGFYFVKAKALEFMDRVAEACETIDQLLSRAPRDVFARRYAAHLHARAGRPERSRHLAAAALADAPDDTGAMEALVCAYLACGDAKEASDLVEQLVALRPMSQLAIALQATAWRLVNDTRFHELYDYETMVRCYPLEVPAGWSSLANYLEELAAELKNVHPFLSHPFGQSVRHGSQRSDILLIPTPAIQGFRQAIAGPVAAYLDHIGRGDGPLRSRNSGRSQIQGAWSVWLRPGGFHADHVHSQGWLSSACYIEVPERSALGGREGWLKFGEPGVPTEPALACQHAIQPKPGIVALFPSYMWHGTIPFRGDEPRLTIAADIVPI